MTSKNFISNRDASRNTGEELLQAIRDVKAGKYGAKYDMDADAIVKARLKSGPSQTEFSAALHISVRTLATLCPA